MSSPGRPYRGDCMTDGCPGERGRPPSKRCPECTLARFKERRSRTNATYNSSRGALAASAKRARLEGTGLLLPKAVVEELREATGRLQDGLEDFHRVLEAVLALRARSDLPAQEWEDEKGKLQLEMDRATWGVTGSAAAARKSWHAALHPQAAD